MQPFDNRSLRPPQAAAQAATGPASTSLSSFLRKDKSGTASSAAASRASTPFSAGNGGGSSPLGGTGDDDEERRRRFDDGSKVGNRFLELKGAREALRASYIASGVLPDPNKPTDLALAIKLTGTCLDMCPEFEREEREFQKELDRFEVYPGTSRVDPNLAVKIYRRPAAGRELPLPEDVRPPPVLKTTLDYLFHRLLPSSPDDPAFTAVQPFLWNRTRAIRQDFIVQSESGPTTIECHERIARYHILCLHWKGGPGAEGWSEQQELEQLRKTLRSLIEFYDDRRRSGHTSPNEAEFRAYNLLLHLRDPETLREVELLPRAIFIAPQVQAALSLRALAQRSNNLERRGQPRNTEATLNFFSRFFAELRKPKVSYLMACLAENSFNSVRVGALKAMSKAYMAQHRALPLSFLVKSLGLDDEAQAVALVSHLGIELDYEDAVQGGVDGVAVPVGVKLSKTSIINEDKPIPSPFSASLVEAKRGRHTCQDVVDGAASGAAPPLPQPALPPKPVVKPPSAPATTAAFGQPAASAFGQSGPSAFGATPSAFGQPAKPAVASAFGGASAFGQSASSAFGTTASAFQAKSPPANATASKLSAASPAFVPSSIKQEAPAPPSKALTGAAPTNGPFAPTTKPAEGPFVPAAVPPKSTFSFADPPKPASDVAAVPRPHQDSNPAKPSIFDKPVSFSASPTRKRPARSTPSAPPAPSKSLLEPAPPPTTQPAAPLSPAPKAVKKRRQIPAAAKPVLTDRAFAALLEPLLDSTVKTAAAAAIDSEKKRRERLAARTALLDKLAEQLYDELATERCRKVAERQAKHAAAIAYEEQSSKRFGWESWKLASQERRQRKEMQERLETVRSELKRRGLASPNRIGRADSFAAKRAKTLPLRRRGDRRRHEADGPDADAAAAEDDDDDDEVLRASFLTAQQKRERLWEEGAFLEAVAQRLDLLVTHFCPVQLQRITTLFHGVGADGGAASAWLRTKFGLSSSDDEAVDVALADGTACVLVAAGPDAQDDMEAEPDVGLVIFECDPRAVRATSAERERIRQQDRLRLDRVAASKAVRQSALSVRLLVIVWSDGTTTERAEDVQRRLGLLALDDSPWDRTAVLELGDATQDSSAAVAQQLARLLPSLSLNTRFKATTLRDITRPLCYVWTETIARIDPLVARLPSTSEDRASVERKALQVLVALFNHLVRVVLHLSETILEPEEESELLLPSSPLTTTGGGLYGAAFGLVEELAVKAGRMQEEQGDDEEGGDAERIFACLAHVQTDLLAREAGGRDLSLPHLLHPLLALTLDRIERVWLHAASETTLGASLETATAELQKLSDGAVRELAEDVRRASLRLRDERGAKRSIEDEEEEDELHGEDGSRNDRTMTLEDLSSPPKKQRSNPPPPASPVVPAMRQRDPLTPASPLKGAGASAIDDLRSLIARASSFLDSRSS